MSKSKAIRMKFGKYTGRAIENIPKDYLMWLLENAQDNFDPVVAAEIIRVLRKWQGMERQKK